MSTTENAVNPAGSAAPAVNPAVETIATVTAELGQRALICAGGSDFSAVPHYDHVKVVGTAWPTGSLRVSVLTEPNVLLRVNTRLPCETGLRDSSTGSLGAGRRTTNMSAASPRLL